MGQFRPSSTKTRRFPPRDLALFVVGFLVSATGSLGLIALAVGGPASSALTREVRLAVLAAGVVILLVIDVVRLRRGVVCSAGFRRQTPRTFGFHAIGPLIWGLDTGLPLTTYRSTPLPVIGLLLLALGFGAPWLGVAYAAGFLGGLVTACYWPRARSHGPSTSDPASLILALRGVTRPIWAGSLVLTTAVALWSVRELALG